MLLLLRYIERGIMKQVKFPDSGIISGLLKKILILK
jgi:hypothetical protein